MTASSEGPNYTPAIGIECHVQLKTKTKLFAAVGNDAREAAPNTLISHICVGMPGALPYLNEAAVELAVRAAFAFNTKPQRFSKFDRKHYFYPDLPKGYQITQYDQPIILGGHVDIEVDGQPKKVGITRVHLEEDAGKTSHPSGTDYSLVDLNRAGTPLLEVVSQPDISSPAEAKAFAREIYLLVRYAGISDGDMYHGNLRFDVNVSVSQDMAQKGIRSEVKNLNSFRSVEAAVAYEIERQIDLLEKGRPVVQETRGWDEAKGKTIGQRGKEEAHDYRYMPEPDIPPLELDDEYISKLKSETPRLPTEWRERLKAQRVDDEQIEILLEAQIAGDNIKYLDMIEGFGNSPDFQNIIQTFVFWFTNIDIPLRREHRGKDLKAEGLKEMYHWVFQKLEEEKKIHSSQAKKIITYLLENPTEADDEIAWENAMKKLELWQITDESEIEQTVAEVIEEFAKAAQDVKNGEAKAIGFLVGQVMAKSKGKANPELSQKIIRQRLGL